MAVVGSPSDVDKFLSDAREENLEATVVAEVTEEPRLRLDWRGKTIVDLSRAFLNTNGAHQETAVTVEIPKKEDDHLEKFVSEKVAADLDKNDLKAAWLDTLSDLNVCSQKGLVEMFDGSIGAASVFMPFGGKYQLTETQSMVAKLPVGNHKCDIVSMMAYGFDPYLSKWSPYHGAIYSITESMAKIVAAGGDFRKIRFTFQEYFRRMNEDPKRWSQPVAALLGAFEAQMRYGLPSIGGKDSMSGTFNDIDVPPTLCSFAVDTADVHDIITPELKKAGDKLVYFWIAKDLYDLPDYDQVMKLYDTVHQLILKKAIVSAYVTDCYGPAAAVSKMAFGNEFGVKIGVDNASPADAFKPYPCCIVAEVSPDVMDAVDQAMTDNGLSDFYTVIGEVTDDRKFTIDDVSFDISEALDAWKAPLEGVFATKADDDKTPVKSELYDEKNVYVCKNKVAKPNVFIPVFPGTNCEYDSAKAFEKAGATTNTVVFRNQNAEDIRSSVDDFVKGINNAQIVMFPGGFSAGDEPEGSAKFFATAFRNEKITEAIENLITKRDGLVLGICNGFQALIKLGLVPYGKVTEQKPDSPTLTYNTIGRHISKIAYTKVVSNKSPWLRLAGLGKVYGIPASHGEGRFVANEEWLDKLFKNGQVATQYVDIDGNCSMDAEWNINGSYRAIEGITSEDGRILGKMCHSERIGDGVSKNIDGNLDMKIFESGVSYLK